MKPSKTRRSAPKPRSISDLATVLGVDRRTVKKAILHAGLKPAMTRGPVRFYRPGLVADALEALSTQTRAPGDLRQQKISEEVRKLKIANDREQGRLVSKADVCDTLSRFFGQQLAMLRQKLENELPSELAGLDAAQIRVRLKRAVDDLCRDHQAVIGKWEI